jgi:hypothetical protein
MRKQIAAVPVILFVLILSLGARCGEEHVAELNDTLALGKPVVVDNVTVWPVYSSKAPEKGGDYISLVQAQEQKLAVIHEVGATEAANAATGNEQQAAQPQNAAGNDHSQSRQHGGGAQVNQLVIENKGDKDILVLAGTLVKGGQQDRQIAQDFIVPAGKTVPVGAFCVEHGRWTNSREGKQTGGVFEAQKCQTEFTVRSSGQYKQDQQEVWANVAKVNDAAAKKPESGTFMATVEETDKDAIARRDKIRNALAEKFKGLAGQKDAPVGIAYAIDGKVHEIRTFNDPRIFDAYNETLVNTVVLEGDIAQRQALKGKAEIYSKEADAKQCVELVKAAEQIKEEQVDTAAGNKNGYKKGDAVYNGNVYAKDGDKTSASPVSQSWVKK